MLLAFIGITAGYIIGSIWSPVGDGIGPSTRAASPTWKAPSSAVVAPPDPAPVAPPAMPGTGSAANQPSFPAGRMLTPVEWAQVGAAMVKAIGAPHMIGGQLAQRQEPLTKVLRDFDDAQGSVPIDATCSDSAVAVELLFAPAPWVCTDVPELHDCVRRPTPQHSSLVCYISLGYTSQKDAQLGLNLLTEALHGTAKPLLLTKMALLPPLAGALANVQSFSLLDLALPTPTFMFMEMVTGGILRGAVDLQRHMSMKRWHLLSSLPQALTSQPTPDAQAANVAMCAVQIATLQAALRWADNLAFQTTRAWARAHATSLLSWGCTPSTPGFQWAAAGIATAQWLWHSALAGQAGAAWPQAPSSAELGQPASTAGPEQPVSIYVATGFFRAPASSAFGQNHFAQCPAACTVHYEAKDASKSEVVMHHLLNIDSSVYVALAYTGTARGKPADPSQSGTDWGASLALPATSAPRMPAPVIMSQESAGNHNKPIEAAIVAGVGLVLAGPHLGYATGMSMGFALESNVQYSYSQLYSIPLAATALQLKGLHRDCASSPHLCSEQPATMTYIVSNGQDRNARSATASAIHQALTALSLPGLLSLGGVKIGTAADIKHAVRLPSSHPLLAATAFQPIPEEDKARWSKPDTAAAQSVASKSPSATRALFLERTEAWVKQAGTQPGMRLALSLVGHPSLPLATFSQVLMTTAPFALTMENSRCHDYITEKPYMALNSGAVPVVRSADGIPSYPTHMPPSSFIDTAVCRDDAACVAGLVAVALREPRVYELFHMWRLYWPWHMSEPLSAMERATLPNRLYADQLMRRHTAVWSASLRMLRTEWTRYAAAHPAPAGLVYPWQAALPNLAAAHLPGSTSDAVLQQVNAVLQDLFREVLLMQALGTRWWSAVITRFPAWRDDERVGDAPGAAGEWDVRMPMPPSQVLDKVLRATNAGVGVAPSVWQMRDGNQFCLLCDAAHRVAAGRTVQNWTQAPLSPSALQLMLSSGLQCDPTVDAEVLLAP